MARSTRNGYLDASDIPAGMRPFEVVGATIKDSTGAYCVQGEMALLNRKLADVYLKRNMIKVALPDDFNDDTTKKAVSGKGDKDATVKPADGQGAETKAAAGANSGEVKP